MSKPSPELRHAADTPLAEIELRMSMRESPLAVAVDWRRLRAEALESPCAGRPAEWPAIHFAAGARADGTYGMQATPQRRLPSPMIVLGGAYAAGPRLAELVDLAVLVEALKSVRRIITFFRPPAGILSSHAAARLRALRTCRSCSIAWPNEAGGKVGLVAAGYVVALLIASAGAALYFLSSEPHFWRARSVGALAIAAPLLALGFVLCALCAPSRSSRIALVVATALEAAVFVYLVVAWFLPALSR